MARRPGEAGAGKLGHTAPASPARRAITAIGIIAPQLLHNFDRTKFNRETAGLAVIFPKGYIQVPVQAVCDAPMLSDGFGDGGGVVFEAGKACFMPKLHAIALYQYESPKIIDM